MNERIQELALQAGAIKCHGYIPHPELDGHLIWAADAALDTKKMDAEKFAQLIVQECEKVIRAEIAVTDISGEVEKAWEMGMECGVGLIKKHFGVEE